MRVPKSLSFEPFTYHEGLLEGLSQYSISKLVEEGELIKLDRGVYCVSSLDIDQEAEFSLATKIIGKPCAVSFLSALSWYDLTDIIPNQVWLTVPESKRTRSKYVKTFRTRTPGWNVGMVSNKKPSYVITSKERTVIDCLSHPKVMSEKIGVDALKVLLSSDPTSGDRVLKMSRKLGAYEIVLDIMKVLL